ncbi:unnamed protein product [Boreogadus saida]
MEIPRVGANVARLQIGQQTDIGNDGLIHPPPDLFSGKSNAWSLCGGCTWRARRGMRREACHLCEAVSKVLPVTPGKCTPLMPGEDRGTLSVLCCHLARRTSDVLASYAARRFRRRMFQGTPSGLYGATKDVLKINK